MKRQRGNASWHFPVFCTGRKAVVMGRCLRLTDSRRWHEDTDSAPGAAGRRSPDSSGASAKFVRQGQVPQRRRRAKASTRMTRARPPAATGRASMASRLSPYCCRTKAAPAKMTPARMALRPTQGRPAPVQAVAVARFIGGQIEAAAGQLRIEKLAGLFGQLVAFQRAQAFVIQFRVALLQQSLFFVVRHGCTGRVGAGACGETISGRKVMRGRPRPSSAPRTRCSNSSLPMTGPSSWPSSVTWASSRAGP